MADEKLDTLVRQEQIAEAALSLVASHGVRRLSMAAVARRVGLVPSGIYRHFKSKDEMLAAVLDLIERRLLANVQAARDDSENALERLHGVFIRHIRFIREGRAIPQIIFSDDMHSGSPQRKGRVGQIVAAYLGQIRRCVEEGQQQGSIRGELDPDTVALMFLGTIAPAGVLWHLTDGGFDVTRHAARVWPMFQNAIARQTV
jgi:AcrR family transcriptional regulator